MMLSEIVRTLAMVIFFTLVIAYPFSVMGPGRPRHTWWAVAMGELAYVAAGFAMVARFHEPVTWRVGLFILGGICGLAFCYQSRHIYGWRLRS